MNPYEVGNLEPREPDAGPFSRVAMLFIILARVIFGIGIVGLIALLLACALIFGLPPEN